MKTVEARLGIQMFLDCPECGYLIDLLQEEDTDGTSHNDDGNLLRQMFPDYGTNADFECDEVVCKSCKTEFNVRGLEW